MRIFWIVILFISTGCSSMGGHREKNIGYSLSAIQTTVAEKIPGGLSKVSQNRREFVSYYFLPATWDETYKESGRLYRGKARVFILGDRRPYDIVVRIDVDTRRATEKEVKTLYSNDDLKKRNWNQFGEDKRLAKRIAEIIVDSLKKSQRNRNLIDDFRAF